MKSNTRVTVSLLWSVALLLASFVAGCGSGQNPILGGGGLPKPSVVTDTTRPRVSVTVPANGATAVPTTNAAITAVFNEVMAPASITTAGTFTVICDPASVVVCVDPSPVGGAATYVVGSKTAVYKPAAFLTAGAKYIATITTAATDLAGNTLAGDPATSASSNYVWTFTVDPAAILDVTPPTVTLENPANTATGVAINSTVNATFSEDMDPTTICGTASLTTACPIATFTVVNTTLGGTDIVGNVNYVVSSRIATFTPTTPATLPANTLFTATITTGAKDLASNALAAGLIPNPWTFTTGSGLAPGAIALGSASTFGIMATSAITCVPSCVINGDVSLDPGTSMTGPPVVNGAIHINDTVSAQARADLLNAYNTAKALPPGTTISAGADLGALYLAGIPPGTYTSGSTMLVSTPLVIDAGGNANAVWVFQIGSSLTTGADVTLSNGAQAKNVFWVPTSDATIGVGTTFEGTIVSGRDVTAVTGATINGRILAGAITAGTIALQSGTTVNVPAP